MNESLFSSLPDQPGTDSAPATENTGQYNDAQLREIYENEEIERFLRLFSTVCESNIYKNQINFSTIQYVNEVKAPRPVHEHSGPSTLPEDEGEMTTSENDKHTPKPAKGQSHSFNNVSDEVAYVGFLTDSYNLLLNLLPIPAFSPSTASSPEKPPSRVHSQSLQACISTCLLGNSPALLSLPRQLISTCEMARQRTKLAFLCSESFFARFFSL